MCIVQLDLKISDSEYMTCKLTFGLLLIIPALFVGFLTDVRQ